MKKTFVKLFATLFLIAFSSNALAKQYPFIDGSALFEFQPDRIMSGDTQGSSKNNAFIYVEPKFSLNFNKNWSIKTQWRFQPNNVLTTRDSNNPERYRNFLQSDRGVSISDNGLLIEELKINFENEDLAFQAGKFDPKFGSASDKSKRIGIFTSQFNEDYNLREKIGFGVSALLEDSKLSFNSFFNDTTGLSESAIDDRGRADRKNNVSGNTGTLSSFSIDLIGENLMGFREWKYNVGYRSLAVDKSTNSEKENGYVLGSSYEYPLGANTTLIPFLEVAKFDNFSGFKSRNALFTTAALSLKYSSWNVGISHLKKDIDDSQMQVFVGYKFSNNLTLDFTRSSIKENGSKSSIAGFLVSYLYQF
jgi:hypothetical protein